MTKIALQSAIGTDISNDQEAGVADGEYERFLQQFRSKWEPVGCIMRLPALLRYNCHGLTFASRRTWIDNPLLIPQLIDEDGYRELNVNATPTAGDIVVYYDEIAQAEHSGIVVAAPENDHALLQFPRVLSKWAKAFEVLHWAHQCPYESRFMRFYRLKENKVKQ